jgi:multiple antibiotic resistance protein
MQLSDLNLKEIISVTIILFSIIDILGSIPVVLDLRKKAGDIHAEKATIVAGGLMLGFLFLGQSILDLFGLDVKSFAIAGAIIIFLIGLEMILGRNIFKHDVSGGSSSSIVPLAFPIIVGAGTMTTLTSLKAAYHDENIIVGIFLNLIIIYIVLRSSEWIERKLGEAGANVLRKVFGMILLAIAIKLFKTNLV